MHRNRKEIATCLVLVLVNLAVFGQVVTHDFVSLDDYRYIVENHRVRAGLTREGLIWALTTGFHRHWHPLTWLSHMLDCEVFGLKAGAHHLVNLVLHIINCLLLFFIFLKMTRMRFPSALVAVLFAVHPLHVETVAWVADRKDLLGALFWFLTMWTYIGYCQRPGMIKFVPVFIFMALGVMCKSSIMTLPFALLLLDYWPLGRLGLGQAAPSENVRFPEASLVKLVREKLPLFVLAAGAAIAAIITIEPSGAAAVDGSSPLPQLSNLPRTICAYAAYVGKTLWPHPLATPYPHPRFSPCPDWKIFLAVLMLAAICILSLQQARQRPYLIVGWLFFLGNLLPVIGLFDFGPAKMADRYTYIPLIGLFVMIAFYLNDLVKHSRLSGRAMRVAIAAACSALMVTAFFQARHWRDSMTLFLHAVQVTQKNELAHNKLGLEYSKAGDTEQAITHFEKALAIRPTYLNARVNLGVLLQRRGNLPLAKQYYLESLGNRPDYAPAHYNLGRALETEGNFDQALYHYRKAVKYLPEYHQAHNNLGVLLARSGRFDEAVSHFRQALKIQPQDAQALNNLGGALQKSGNLKDAKKQYLMAIRVEPENASARYNLAGILESEGDLTQAVNLYHGILKTNSRSAEAYLGLGRIAESRGQLQQAMGYYQKALKLKPGFHPARSGLERVEEKIGRRD